VTRKSKIPAKSLGLASPGPKRPSGIRLNDLMPKKRITGGKGLLFGASDSSQLPTNQPGETTWKKTRARRVRRKSAWRTSKPAKKSKAAACQSKTSL